MGIPAAGPREVLAFITGDRENELAWTDLLSDLQRRGLQSGGLWITDGNQAMLNALAAKFPTTPRQRGGKHTRANVLSYIPKAQQAQVEPELISPAARKLTKSGPLSVKRTSQSIRRPSPA